MDHSFEIPLIFISIILSLLVISADLFLIITICRFKKLRVRTNMYILNCCILNIFYIPSSPVFLLLERFHIYGGFHLRIINPLLVFYVVFATSLAVDWLLSSCIPNMMQKLDKFSTCVFLCLYVALFIDIVYVISNMDSYADLVDKRYYIYSAIFLVSVIIVVVIDILAKTVNFNNRSYKAAYSLTTTNIMIFSYVPLLTYHFVYFHFYGERRTKEGIDWEYLPLIIALGHPILVAYMLGKQNKYFKVAYKRSFQKRSVRDYADEDLDDNSADENNGNSVNINHLTERGQE